jgi:hypothetical protein
MIVVSGAEADPSASAPTAFKGDCDFSRTHAQRLMSPGHSTSRDMRPIARAALRLRLLKRDVLVDGLDRGRVALAVNGRWPR